MLARADSPASDLRKFSRQQLQIALLKLTRDAHVPFNWVYTLGLPHFLGIVCAVLSETRLLVGTLSP